MANLYILKSMVQPFKLGILNVRSDRRGNHHYTGLQTGIIRDVLRIFRAE